MTTLYALVINDRHLSTQVRLFAVAEAAVAELQEFAADAEWPVDDPAVGGWLASCGHPTEGDHAFVIPVVVETPGVWVRALP